jgi:hypothetical protein
MLIDQSYLAKLVFSWAGIHQALRTLISLDCALEKLAEFQPLWISLFLFTFALLEQIDWEIQGKMFVELLPLSTR